MESIINNALEEGQRALSNLQTNKSTISNIAKAGHLLATSLKNGNHIYSCGNGGSMCDAMHFAEELSGRFRKDRKPFAATAISDPAHISCTANDFGYDQIFSRYLDGAGRAGDVLLAISTSGTSSNVLNAAKTAQSLGMQVISLTGRKNSAIGTTADIDICTETGTEFADRVQELHIKCIHILIELCEHQYFSNY